MNKIEAHLTGGSISSNFSEAFSLHKKSSFGEPVGEKVQYSFSEALYLVEAKRIEIFQKKDKLAFKELFSKLQKLDKRIGIKYPVFKSLRERGYVVKTALKFGADFRVYDKGSKPGKKHAKWVTFCDRESKYFTWHDFSAKNRVAHSTKKNLLLAIVDDEEDVSYYEVSWIKP